MVKEIIMTLLQAFLTASVPVLVSYICVGIKRAVAALQESSHSEAVSALLADAESAVTTAVRYTSQTYVDALKDSGQFSVESQKKALDMAYGVALKIMRQEALDLLERTYGSADVWLRARIEAAVAETKK